MTGIRTLVLAGLTIGFAGCASLPDAQPFTDATVGLRRAVVSSGSAVVAEMRSAKLSTAATQAKKLEEAWATRNRAMTALVEYAHSLQRIADAGRSGAASAMKLAEAANGLTQSLGAASLGASAAGALAVDTFAYAYGQIARARAAKSLDTAMSEVQPAIDRLTVLFAADLRALDETVTLAIRAQRDALEDANQNELGFRRQLTSTQRALMRSIRAELGEDRKSTEVRRVDELARVTQLLAENEAWNSGYENEQAAISQRGRLAHEIIAATQAAFADWATAHARLLVAVKSKRIPSVGELLEATARINDLVERYRYL